MNRIESGQWMGVDLFHQPVKQAFADEQLIAQPEVLPVEVAKIAMELVAVVLGKIAVPEPEFVPVALIFKGIEFLPNSVHRISGLVAALKEGVDGRWTDSLIAIAPQAGGKGVVNTAIFFQTTVIAQLILTVVRLETILAAGTDMVCESAGRYSLLAINHADPIPVATFTLFTAERCTAGKQA